MLNFIYYPVSFILWVWHKAFGYLFGEASGITWALAVVFLVFTLRAILYKPFVHQVRSMRKMQEFQPEIAKLRKKYANDRQKQTEEMQRLQTRPRGQPARRLPADPGAGAGVHRPVPRAARVQAGQDRELLLRRGRATHSFIDASFFGAKLGAWVTHGRGRADPARHLDDPDAHRDDPADDRGRHLHPHHGPALGGPADRRPGREPADRDHEQADAVRVPDRCGGRRPVPAAGGADLLGGEQPVDARPAVRRLPRIDAEEAARKDAVVAAQQARAPRPGQKPVRPETGERVRPAKTPGAKPAAAKAQSSGGARAAKRDAAPSGTGRSANGAVQNGRRRTGPGRGRAAGRRARGRREKRRHQGHVEKGRVDTEGSPPKGSAEGQAKGSQRGDVFPNGGGRKAAQPAHAAPAARGRLRGVAANAADHDPHALTAGERCGRPAAIGAAAPEERRRSAQDCAGRRHGGYHSGDQRRGPARPRGRHRRGLPGATARPARL